jgi:heat shock protein HslJ
MRNRVTMPKWPAWILFGAAAACAYPAVTSPPPADPTLEHYEARGNEPGWHLLIHGGRLEYTGNYGEKKIAIARPDPRPSFNGRRYESQRLTVDVTYSRCNDDMSGFGFEHQVTITADGETYRGCGGERRKDWDL